jgi:hypothetical protein
VIISVSDPEVKKEYGGAKQYYLYTIKGQDSKGIYNYTQDHSTFNVDTLISMQFETYWLRDGQVAISHLFHLRSSSPTLTRNFWKLAANTFKNF